MDFQLSALSEALNGEIGAFAHSELAAILRDMRGETGSDRLNHREAGTVIAAALVGGPPADALQAVRSLRLSTLAIPVNDGPAVVVGAPTT